MKTLNKKGCGCLTDCDKKLKQALLVTVSKCLQISNLKKNIK